MTKTPKIEIPADWQEETRIVTLKRVRLDGHEVATIYPPNPSGYPKGIWVMYNDGWLMRSARPFNSEKEAEDYIRSSWEESQRSQQHP